MKFHVLISIATMLLSTNIYAQFEARALQTTFGRYGAECSSGRGVCSFSIDQHSDSKTSSQTAAKLSDNTIRITVKRISLAAEDEQRIAGKLFDNTSTKDDFLQQENFKVSIQTLQALNIDSRYNMIAAGAFPMVITKEEAEITFTLTAAQ